MRTVAVRITAEGRFRPCVRRRPSIRLQTRQRCGVFGDDGLEFLRVEVQPDEDGGRDLCSGHRGLFVAMVDARTCHDEWNVAVGRGEAAVFGDLRRAAGVDDAGLGARVDVGDSRIAGCRAEEGRRFVSA